MKGGEIRLRDASEGIDDGGPARTSENVLSAWTATKVRLRDKGRMMLLTAVDDDVGEEISSASCRTRYGEIGEEALIVVILVASVTSDEA